MERVWWMNDEFDLEHIIGRNSYIIWLFVGLFCKNFAQDFTYEGNNGNIIICCDWTIELISNLIN